MLIEELFTSDSPKTAWSTHLEGAASLVQARGVDIANCILGMKGLKLYLQFRSQLVRCLINLEVVFTQVS